MEGRKSQIQCFRGRRGQQAVGSPDVSAEPTAEPRTHSSNDFLCAGLFSTRPPLDPAPPPEPLWRWCDVWTVAPPGGGGRVSSSKSWVGTDILERSSTPKGVAAAPTLSACDLLFHNLGAVKPRQCLARRAEMSRACSCLLLPAVHPRSRVGRWGLTGPLPHS